MKLSIIFTIIVFLGVASHALDETPVESTPVESEDRFGIQIQLKCPFICPAVSKPVCGIEITTFNNRCNRWNANICQGGNYIPIACGIESLLKKQNLLMEN